VTRYFGDRIAELRNEKDLSVRDLAKMVGVSAPFLTDVEKKRRYPAEDTLVKLAAALGTTVEDLKTYDNRPPTKELTELADEDVGYAFAFRRIVDSVRSRGLSPEEVERQFFASEDPTESMRRILTGEKPEEDEK
jgi:transcriptional regulator with XRE-family HTH domain